jgi:hypothetical protein
LPASAGAAADNVLQTFRSRAELTFRAPVLFQRILVQFPHPMTMSHILSYLDFKESAQSGVHPRRNMPGTGVGNFGTLAAAHLL